MKKRMLCVLMAIVFCFASISAVQAADTEKIESEKGALFYTFALEQNDDGTHCMWATVTTSFPEMIIVRLRLYRMVSGFEIFIVESPKVVKNGTYCHVERDIRLVTGDTYILELIASGDTTSGTVRKTYEDVGN